MEHVKLRDGLQPPGDGRLGLHERLELHEQLGLHELKERSDERPLENDKHMVMNGRLRYELHAFLSPNFLHLRPIDFLVVFRRHHHLWPQQKMQATQDCTVVRVKMKNKGVKKINQNFSLNTVKKITLFLIENCIVKDLTCQHTKS